MVNSTRVVIPSMLLFFLCAAHGNVAQSQMRRGSIHSAASSGGTESLFAPASVSMDTLYRLDEARKVKQMDATPNGSRWFVVDEFAHWQYITMNGKQFPKRYHDISGTGTRLSPNGDYILWTGLMHAVTKKHGFDSTTASLYKDTSLIVQQTSDYPQIEFSRTGTRWAETLPKAFMGQTGDCDLVVVDGNVVRKNIPISANPQFSFSHDERHWAYRSTNGLLEELETDRVDSPVVLYQWPVPTDSSVYNATVWRYTPDVSWNHQRLEGRDYDFSFAHVARQNKTAYSSLSADTLRTYVNFNGRNEGLYRWSSQFMIDDSGHHIAYVACDPAITHSGSADERRAVIVYDGKIVGGPYPGVLLLFMSPTGKHIAYSVDPASSKFYLDKKVLAKTSAIVDAVWSPDESHVAIVSGGAHGKLFVVVDGKRSPLFEQIGHVGWSADGNTVLFTGISNGHVITVRQRL